MKPLSDPNSSLRHRFDDWPNCHQQSVAVSFGISSSSSVPRCTKTNSQKNLSAILDLPGLRSAAAHEPKWPWL